MEFSILIQVLIVVALLIIVFSVLGYLENSERKTKTKIIKREIDIDQNENKKFNKNSKL